MDHRHFDVDYRPCFSTADGRTVSNPNHLRFLSPKFRSAALRLGRKPVLEQSEVREGVRLSPQQRHVWSLQQDDQRQYRSECVAIVAGKLRINLLAAALRETVSRHEMLRS